MPLPPLYDTLISHHPPHERYRCSRLAGRYVCRRCFALYPATLLILALQYSPLAFDLEWRPWLFGLAFPATLDHTLERLGRLRYHPSRVVFSALLLALPLGYGLHAYLEDWTDPWFWALLLFNGIPAGAATLWRGWRDLNAPHGGDPTL